MSAELEPLIAEMRRLSRLLDQGVVALTKAGAEHARAEHEYRQARAVSWARAKADGQKRTVGDIEAEVDLMCSDLMLRRYLADAQRNATLEAVRSRRTQLSACQSIASAIRAEAEFSRTGPM